MEYRSAVLADLPFVLSLHHQTLREYIEPIWGWDQSRWDGIITKWFRPERVQIIRKNSEDIGLLVVEEKPGELFFESISLLPVHQRKGLGGKIIKDMIERAERQKLPIRLEVLRTNLPAWKLYQRHGFVVHEETPTHFKMEYAPR